MIFSPKQKLFQIPLAIVKQIKKIFKKKKYFWGVLGVPKIAKNAKNAIFEDP